MKTVGIADFKTNISRSIAKVEAYSLNPAIVDFQAGIDDIHGVAVPVAGPVEADAGCLTVVTGVGGPQKRVKNRVNGRKGTTYY